MSPTLHNPPRPVSKFLPVAVAAGAIVLFVGIYFSFTYLFKKSDAYKAAVEHLRHNSELQAITGGIKDFGHFPDEAFSKEDNKDIANLTISVNAYKNDVYAHVQLAKQSGKWEVVNMNIIDTE